VTAASVPLRERAAYKALWAHREPMLRRDLRQLFRDDPQRGARFRSEALGLYVDFAKQRIEAETLRLIFALAEESGLGPKIEAMFRGDKLNFTENRAVLHVALRTPRGRAIVVDGEDVVPKVHEVLDRMADFATRVRGGVFLGHTGKPIVNIVNIV